MKAKHKPRPVLEWENICRRTGDPKLKYFEKMLDAKGIPHRRKGESWHGPILQVPMQHADAAWELLLAKLPGQKVMFDEMDDDHPMFIVSQGIAP